MECCHWPNRKDRSLKPRYLLAKWSSPFVSFAQHLHDTNDKREIVVLHGASYVDELSYKRLLTDMELESEKVGRDKWNFRYRAAISRPKEFFNRSWNQII